MSLTNDQLEERVLVIEEKLNEIQIAINSLATKQQMKQLTLIRQQEIVDLQNRVTSLESQITALQEG